MLIDLLAAIIFLVLFVIYSGNMFLIKKYEKSKSPINKDFSHKFSVSIIIPTYNEELIVSNRLKNLFELNYPLELCEIIFIDSSNDRTPQIIRDYQEKYQNICLINEGERMGVATALNKAFSAAKNEIVVRTDCDSFWHKDVLYHMMANFADPTIGAVCGKQNVLNKSKVEEGYRSIQLKLQIVESWLDSTIIFHGPCFGFRKDLLVPIDPASLADDSELAVKIRKQGYRTIIDPEIVFYEASQSRFMKRRVQKDRRAKGLIRLLLQHKDVLFNSKYGKYGMIVFPMNYFMMIISPYLILALLLLVLFKIYLYSVIGFFGACIAMTTFMYLGQADKLLIFEPIYSFIDSQISLFLGGLSLIFGKNSKGTWKKDEELRNSYLD